MLALFRRLALLLIVVLLLIRRLLLLRSLLQRSVGREVRLLDRLSFRRLSLVFIALSEEFVEVLAFLSIFEDSGAFLAHAIEMRPHSR